MGSGAVGVAVQGDDVGVVDEPVDGGCGDGLVTEDAAAANWDWLKLLLRETACGVGRWGCGVPPTIRGGRMFLLGVTLILLV